MALSARTKLFGGFGVGILAVLIAVIVGITQIRTADGKADGLYNDSLEQTSRTGTLRRDMLQMRVSILQYVLSPADKRADFGAKIKTFQDSISTDLENLRGEKLTAAQTEQLTAAEESITAWYEARDKGPIGKTDAGDSAGATQAALFGQGGQRFQDAFDKVVEFGGETDRAAKAAQASAASTQSRTTAMMIGITIVAVLLAAALAFFIADRAVSEAQLEEKSAMLEFTLVAEREHARRDPLTNALNHGAISEVLRDLVSGSRTDMPACAVAMVDVDGMKAVNDTYGHQAGDMVLITVANALGHSGALVGRYGGDEFVVILPGAGRDEAERYRDAVLDDLTRAELVEPETRASIPVRVSVGLAIYPEEAQTVAELVTLSDSAMYAAKRQRSASGDDLAGLRPMGDDRSARMVGELAPLLTSPGDANSKLRLVAHRLSVGAGYDAVDFTLFAPAPGAPLATNAFARIPADVLEAWRRHQAADDSPEPHPLRTYFERSPRPVIIEDFTNSELVTPDQCTILAAAGLCSGLVAPLIWQDEVVGMLAVGSKRQAVFTAQDAQFVGAVATQVTAIVRMAQLVDELQEATARLAGAQAETVMMLAAAAEAHDRETGLHLLSIRTLAEALARELGYADTAVRDLGLAAVLHDIGKISVPDAVLSSSGSLQDDEWELMKRHTLWGAEFLSGKPGFDLAATVARSHHERWDGGGYPDGLTDGDIPEAAAIVTVADSFDAMTHDRPYKQGRPIEDAIQEIAACSGKQFSPRVVEALLRLHQRGELPHALHGPESDRVAA